MKRTSARALQPAVSKARILAAFRSRYALRSGGRLRARRSRPSRATPARSTRSDRAGSDDGDGPSTRRRSHGIDVSKLDERQAGAVLQAGRLAVVAVRQGAQPAHVVTHRYRRASARRSRSRYVRRAARGRGHRDAGPRGVRQEVQGAKPAGEARRLEGAARRHRRRADPPRRVLRLRVPALRSSSSRCSTQVAQSTQGKVVVYYMMFPLDKHQDSQERRAGRARRERSWASSRRCTTSCSRSRRRTRKDDVMGYAKELGLDLGEVRGGLQRRRPRRSRRTSPRVRRRASTRRRPCTSTTASTKDPLHPKYIEMWIDEELAVNR